MLRKRTTRQLLSFILAVAACFSLLPHPAAEAESAWERVTDASQLIDGGEFLLFTAYSREGVTNYYAVGTLLDRKLDAIPVTDGTDPNTLPRWTVEACEDGVSLRSGTAYLTYDTRAYFGTGEAPAPWSVTEVGEDIFHFVNEGSGKTIAYYFNEGNGRFGLYDSIKAGDGQYSFDLMVYKLSETERDATEPEETALPSEPEETLPLESEETALPSEPEETPPSEPEETTLPSEPEALVSDGTYVIWTPGHAMALSSEQTSDYYLKGTPVSDTGNGEIWTVENNADGTVTLSSDGKKLSLSDDYDSPVWDSLYDSWNLIGCDGACLIQNAGRPTQYLSWNGNFETWSTYVLPEGEPDAFALLFTPVEKTEEQEPPQETEPPPEDIPAILSGGYRFYFGQLHSHTDISDGEGSVEDAFAHASQVEGLDFLAVTDHSNSFDNDVLGILGQDGTAVSAEWKAGREAAAAVTNGDFVGIYGFEMTWHNGLGHISTFNTPGWLSRNQSDYEKLSTALPNYYASLAEVHQSISQFNHPGDLYGDFEDFDHYSPEADRVITLIEVGNSETGSAYDAYIRALDKGWHLAPTNNQDNHKGSWGDADTGRTVVLAPSLTEEAIYDALGNYRVYATEDSDLTIEYTLNGNLMGSRLFGFDTETAVNLSITVNDATDGAACMVEVIVDGGACIASQTVDGAAEIPVPSGYSYYFLRINQPDGDTAITAPVWVETVEAVHVSRLEADNPVTVAGEEESFTIELTNNHKQPFAVHSMTITNRKTGEILCTDSAIASVPGEGKSACSFTHTFETDGAYTITATVKGILDGVEKTVTRDLEITVLPRTIISDVIVDGTHGGDFSAENLIAIAAAKEIKAHVETREITLEQLESCALLVIPAPTVEFTPEFCEMVAGFISNGGNVLLCGASDGTNHEAAARINSLLSAIGSTMTLSDDRVYDPASNGGQPHLLYPDTFQPDSPWTAGIREGQVYSHLDGCSVNPGSSTWLVMGLDTTFSVDADSDGKELNGDVYTEIVLNDEDSPKEINYDLVKAGKVCLLAAEATEGGTVFLGGSFFPDDSSMQWKLDNSWDIPYANRTIFENILGITRTLPTVTPIADVRASEDGRIFLIEGYVTAGTANPNTTFPDTIYLQDATGGIALLSYSEAGLALGTKLRVTGCTETDQGDRQLRILNCELLEESHVIAPGLLDNASAMDYAAYGGWLTCVEGEVVEVTLTADGMGVSRFVLKDERGGLAAVIIENGIFSGSTGKNTLASIVRLDNRVSVVGLVYSRGETVLRVRDCDEVLLLATPDTGGNPPTGDTGLLPLLWMALSLLGMVLFCRKAKIDSATGDGYNGGK